MITKRTNLLAGSLLGGALLLGTAGLVLAQDPTPTPSATTETPGGMMNGQGMGAGQGMMNGQGMGAGQMPDMTAMHAAMGQTLTLVHARFADDLAHATSAIESAQATIV